MFVLDGGEEMSIVSLVVLVRGETSSDMGVS